MINYLIKFLDYCGKVLILVVISLSMTLGFVHQEILAQQSRAHLVSHELLNVTNTRDAIAVIVSDRLFDSVKYLKQVYDNLNIKYRVFKLNDVLMMFPAGNEYESLRMFARYVRYVLNYRYLLLIGDDISFAYFYLNDSLSIIEGTLKSTDMYYSLLDGTWDSNGNGKLLEPMFIGHSCIVKEELPDLTPDLIVGRLPFSSINEVKKYYINTVINFLWKTSRRINVLLIASLIMLPGEEGNKYTIDGASALVGAEVSYLNKVSSMNVTRIFEGDGLVKSKYRSDLPLNRKSVSKVLIKGNYDIILIISHGNGVELARKVWLRDDGDWRAEDDEIAYRAFLRYDEIPQIHSAPIIYIDSCLVNAIDLIGDNAIGAVLLKKGALAVIAPTRTTYYKINYLSPYFNDELLELFIKHLIETYPILDPATAFYKSRAEYLIKHVSKFQACSNLKNALVYTFFGDPILIKYLFMLRSTYNNLHKPIAYNYMSGTRRSVFSSLLVMKLVMK